MSLVKKVGYVLKVLRGESGEIMEDGEAVYSVVLVRRKHFFRVQAVDRTIPV